ncbi:hypothetical protein Ancab_002852 [Ancistrocladus abbreviatus]
MKSKRAGTGATAATDDDDELRSHKRPNFPGETSRHTELAAAAAAETAGLRLLSLLLQCAECVAMNNHNDATDLLLELSELASPYGSPPERVAAYFVDALRARIINSRIGIHCPLPKIKTLNLAQMQAFYAAFQSYNSLSPFVKFSHFTANQAIYEALDGEDRVHVIDLDIMQGLQWPGLFHILASRPRKISSIRVTGIGSSTELLEKTGRRLAEFAASLGLPFEFNSVEGKIGEIADLSLLRIRSNEATVVHWLQHSLYDITGSDLETMRVLQAINPKLITVVEQDLSKTGSFLARFVEALHFYSALFDALDVARDGSIEESVQRHQVEQRLFGWEIRNIVAVGGPKRGGGEVKVERWGEELMRLGFRRFSLAGSPAAQAGLLLGMSPWNWKGYSLVEENGCLKLGWKDLPLLTASAWQPAV